VPVSVDDASGCFRLSHLDLLEKDDWIVPGVSIKYVLSSVPFSS
jgi:hypothetical protein